MNALKCRRMIDEWHDAKCIHFSGEANKQEAAEPCPLDEVDEWPAQQRIANLMALIVDRDQAIVALGKRLKERDERLAKVSAANDELQALISSSGAELPHWLLKSLSAIEWALYKKEIAPRRVGSDD